MRTLLAAAVACLTIVGLSRAAESQAAIRKTFNIPAQGLGPALKTLSKEHGVHVVFMLEDVNRLSTEGISGEMTLDQALDRLLKGTGLAYEYADRETVTIVPSALQPARNERNVIGATHGLPARLRFARASAAVADASEQNSERGADDAEAAKQPTQELEEIIVTGKVSFVENDAFGATKMGLPLKDTPFTVMSINSDMVDIASVRSIGDLGKLDASGAGNERDGASDAFYTRGGFPVDERVDGFRSIFSGLGVSNELAAFERVELVKGGISTVYGQGSPGGIVNYVSKLPEPTAAARFKSEAGSNNYQRLEADLTGPVFGSERWSYRVIAAGQNDDTFRDHSRDDRVMVTPSLMYRGESGSLILRAIYQTQDVSYSTNAAGALQLDAPLPAGMTWQAAVANRLANLQAADIPRSRWLVPIGSGLENDVFQIQMQHDYALSTGWKIRSNIQYATNRVDRTTVTVLGPYDVDGNPMSEREVNSLFGSDALGAEVNLFGGFELFGRDHTLFIGIDYASSDGYSSNFATGDRNTGTQNTVLNLFDPDYAAARNLVTLDEAQRNSFYPGLQENSYFGTTAQVILKPLDGLNILFGGRFSSDSTGFVSNATALQGRSSALRAAHDLDASAARTVFDNFSKQAGISYALTQGINIYASFSESFTPSSARSFVEGSTVGKVIAPPLAETYELGFKGQLGTALGFSLAWFDVKQDAVVPDLDHPTYSILLPGAQSQGVEMSLQGQLLDGLNIFASVAWQDAEYERRPYQGMISSTAPEFGLSLFGTYELLTGKLRGLGVGAGVIHKSGRRMTATDLLRYADGTTFRLDLGDYTSIDARIFYNREHWGVYGAVTNLTDETHLTDSGLFPVINGLVLMNAGRQMRLGATFEF